MWNLAARLIGREMDYAFASGTGTCTCACTLALVVALVLPAPSFSRTVQPISYSLGIVNDGETESSIQYGTHTASPLSKSLSKHPSRLAHHYYDPPTRTSTWPSRSGAFVDSISPANTIGGPRKAIGDDKIRKAPTTSTEAISTLAADPTSTESIVSPVRVRKKGRWLRVRNEIPVNEDPGGETPPDASPRPSPSIETNRVASDRTSPSVHSGNGRPNRDFESTRNSSKLFRGTSASRSRVPKNGTRPAAGGVKTNGQKWSYLRSSATENASELGRVENSGLADAASSVSARPTQVLHYTTKASVEMEIDFVTRKPVANFKPNRPDSSDSNRQYDRKYESASRNVDRSSDRPEGNSGQLDDYPPSGNEGELYDSADRNVDHSYNGAGENDDRKRNPPNGNADQRYYPPNGEVDQPPIPFGGNAGLGRKINVSAKTTPVPKYKEAYFKRPPNRPRITAETLASSTGSGRFADASDREKDRVEYENASASTTERAYNFPESEREASDLGDESARVPGTHRESLTYSDTEKSEKTEEILRDLEYPDEEAEDEDEEEEEKIEADEEARDPVEENASKILQKPMRYAYSSDQNISQSESRAEPQNEASRAPAKKKEGGGEKHRWAHHKSAGDKAEEDYESAVEYDKANKGHSDKENRKHHQEEERGAKKKLHEEGGHRDLHRVSSKGEKATLFGESGSHKKGHSTKGSHNVHKKNEFLKKHEFYDEHHEDDEHKKYGDYHKGHNYVKDDTYKKQRNGGDYSEGHKGEMGKNRNGHRFRQHKGHDDAFKHVDHYADSRDYGQKGGHSEGKKWKYETL